MATVHMTFTDTASGGVAVHSDFQPAIGKGCTKAEAAALEIFNRTRKEWGMTEIEVVHVSVAMPSTALCECDLPLTLDEIDRGKCACCGKAVLV